MICVRHCVLALLWMASLSGLAWAEDAGIPKPNPRWETECKVDSMTDKNECAIVLKLDRHKGSNYFVASLVSHDSGKTWSYISAPGTFTLDLRIDKNKAFSFDAVTENYFTCHKCKSGELTRQLKTGKVLTIRANTAVDDGDQVIPIVGFNEALAEARAKQSP